MCILLVWFLERVVRIETMSSIQHCHIPVEAILNGQMTLEAQHNCNQCRSIMWGVFVVSIFKILASFQNQNRFHLTIEVLLKRIDITVHIHCHRVHWDKIIFQCKRLTALPCQRLCVHVFHHLLL